MPRQARQRMVGATTVFVGDGTVPMRVAVGVLLTTSGLVGLVVAVMVRVGVLVVRLRSSRVAPAVRQPQRRAVPAALPS
jgi:hypothetical protein